MAIAPIIKPLHSIHPGEWYFGVEYERLHTVLGSCVALTAWHPTLKVGGMCHYLLATEPSAKNAVITTGKIARQTQLSDCRYAVNALAEMKKAMLAYAGVAEYQLGVFGGGDMFAYSTPTSIGHDNIAYIQQWLKRENLQPVHTDVGGAISRSLMLVVSTGEIQLKHYQMNQQ
jgi:chemotaxis protein CheD